MGTGLFIEAFDRVADNHNLTRPKLLLEIGVRSRSLAYYWSNGGVPTEQHCLELALFEQRKGALSDAAAADAARRWLDLTGRTDPNRYGTPENPDKLIELLHEQRLERAGDAYEAWISRVIRELESHGPEWSEWVKACFHAQAAARYAREEWFKNPSHKEVWHLHYWNPSLSGTAFETLTMEDFYKDLLSLKFTKVYLMVLYDGRSDDPMASSASLETNPSDDEQRQRDMLRTFIQDMAKDHDNFRAYAGAYRDQINTGDIWAFESVHDSFGFVVRTPARLPSIMEELTQIRQAKLKLVDVIALPIRLRRAEYLPIFEARSITHIPGREDFGLRIAAKTPPNVTWRDLLPRETKDVSGAAAKGVEHEGAGARD